MQSELYNNALPSAVDFFEAGLKLEVSGSIVTFISVNDANVGH